MTRHFVDPSLAAAALGAGPERLLADPETLGLVFESLVIRDVRIYAQAMGASVAHYREAKGVEADAIVETRDGRWAALEVKLGQRDIDRGADSLLRVAATWIRAMDRRPFWRSSPSGDTPTGVRTACSSFRLAPWGLEPMPRGWTDPRVSRSGLA